MKKLTIKDLIDFRSKSDGAKRTFVNNLKLDKEKEKTDGGGHYWVTSLSAISNAYRQNELKFIAEKVVELRKKIKEAEYDRTKIMFQRNNDILKKYEDFDLTVWQPKEISAFLSRRRANPIITIKGLQVQTTPHHVFTFKEDKIDVVGAIWFNASLDGYTHSDLGMFADVLYKYLKVNFSDNYIINPNYCLAVDVASCNGVNYSQIQKGEIHSPLNATLNEIGGLM